jgi:hypothetical protein
MGRRKELCAPVRGINHVPFPVWARYNVGKLRSQVLDVGASKCFSAVLEPTVRVTAALAPQDQIS